MAGKVYESKEGKKLIVHENQYIVSVNKKEYEYIDSPYGRLDIEATYNAFKNLSHAANGLYQYIALNESGYEFALSYVAVHNAIGISRPTFDRAKKELIEKGYLIKRDNDTFDFLDFYDIPQIS